jgi:hypothetical protein
MLKKLKDFPIFIYINYFLLTNGRRAGQVKEKGEKKNSSKFLVKKSGSKKRFWTLGGN